MLAALAALAPGCGGDAAPGREADADAAHSDGGADAVAGDPDTDEAPIEADFSLRLLPQTPDGINPGLLVAHVVGDVPASSVTFAVDGRELAIDDRLPYAVALPARDFAEGVHELVATVGRGSGPPLVLRTGFVVDMGAPVVDIIDPGSSALVVAEGVLHVSIAATDAHGVMAVRAGVGARVGDVAGPDYESNVDVSQLPPGEHVVAAIVSDFSGRSASATRSFQVCDAGTVSCRGVCASPAALDDTDDCGACGLECDHETEVCSEGACACAPHATACGGRCVDTRVDAANCGGCDESCGQGEVCVSGDCATIPDGFVVVPAGSYVRGADAGRPGARAEDGPAHPVSITRPFMIATTEVTQSQWAQRMPWSPSQFGDCGGACPIDSVTWWEALLYTNLLSEAEGLRPCYSLSGCPTLPAGTGWECLDLFVDAPRQDPTLCEGYRLPTEAEWEYAARAGSQASTFAGSARTADCGYDRARGAIAWYACNSGGRPHPVGELAPNAFGLYDTAGNVSEWTFDAAGSYSGEPLVDPFVRTPLIARVVRGGSYASGPLEIAHWRRSSQIHLDAARTVGFRVARTVPGGAP